jgi:multisubunit Na+/H+ antiporter MnhG subunit
MANFYPTPRRFHKRLNHPANFPGAADLYQNTHECSAWTGGSIFSCIDLSHAASRYFIAPLIEGHSVMKTLALVLALALAAPLAAHADNSAQGSQRGHQPGQISQSSPDSWLAPY